MAFLFVGFESGQTPSLGGFPVGVVSKRISSALQKNRPPKKTPRTSRGVCVSTCSLQLLARDRFHVRVTAFTEQHQRGDQAQNGRTA